MACRHAHMLRSGRPLFAAMAALFLLLFSSPGICAAEGPGDYVGWKACSGCHEKAAADWQKGRHAGAFADLQKSGQENLPACVRCHVTGHGRPGGFVDGEITPDLAGVQCEACHGPGRNARGIPGHGHHCPGPRRRDVQAMPHTGPGPGVRLREKGTRRARAHSGPCQGGLRLMAYRPARPLQFRRHRRRHSGLHHGYRAKYGRQRHRDHGRQDELSLHRRYAWQAYIGAEGENISSHHLRHEGKPRSFSQDRDRQHRHPRPGGPGGDHRGDRQGGPGREDPGDPEAGRPRGRQPRPRENGAVCDHEPGKPAARDHEDLREGHGGRAP